MRDFAASFYHSKQWKCTRNAYAEKVNHLCERCLAKGRITAGEIVHHKTHLSPDNINNPSITLSFDNLELLCRKCHAIKHPEIYGKDIREQRVMFDENGNVIVPKNY